VKPVARILDANANRAREALRVLEDTARLGLDHAPLARRYKKLRHDLAGAVRALGPLAGARDTPGDVGTAIQTEAESTRRTVRDVAAAAAKRLTEALRALEEFAKLRGPAAGAAFEAIRYRAYEAERLLLAAVGGAARQWRLCVILTADQCPGGRWRRVARAALDAGADCLQLRDKNLSDAERLDRAAALVALARGGADVVVNDRLDIALAAGAAGVHLGVGDLPIDAARRQAGGDLLIGASTHSLAEAKAALAAGADGCGVGAVFPTDTKRRRPSGLAYVRRFTERHPGVPHLAIGGITPDNAAAVVDAGARGLAVSAVVCRAAKPEAVVRKLLRKIPKS